ncbi:hypothetical protein Tco_0276019 [Tanacetum coccineum]
MLLSPQHAGFGDQQGNVIDHNSKDSGSYMLKRFNYVDLQGRLCGFSNVGGENSVLFTETECHILSPDFKLLDESQVLLKVPRHDNMYSFDLKNVVPSGGNASFTFGLGEAVLTCLAVLIDDVALGELCLAALTGTCPDFVATAVGTKKILGCG